jgi:hypothetical protein
MPVKQHAGIKQTVTRDLTYFKWQTPVCVFTRTSRTIPSHVLSGQRPTHSDGGNPLLAFIYLASQPGNFKRPNIKEWETVTLNTVTAVIKMLKCGGGGASVRSYGNHSYTSRNVLDDCLLTAKYHNCCIQFNDNPVESTKTYKIPYLHAVEPLLVIKLIKTFPVFYRTRQFITIFRKNQSLASVLSRMNAVHKLAQF